MYTDLRLYISNRFLVRAVTIAARRTGRRCGSAFASNIADGVARSPWEAEDGTKPVTYALPVDFGFPG